MGRSIILVIAVAVILSTGSCNAFAPSQGAIQTAIALTRASLPTKSPIPPTVTTTPTPIPTPTHTLIPSTATSTPSMFFVEEFDEALSADWDIDSLGPNGYDITKIDTKIKDGVLQVTITGEYFYAYNFYNRFSYEDVRLDLRAENRGVNNNSITLICRKNNNGWIEFNVTSGGYWDLLTYNSEGSNTGYQELTSGGTLELKQGKETNEYSLICNDQFISMYINGIELKGSPYNTDGFSAGLLNIEGQIGFSISSFNVTPVIVDIDWLKVSEP